jgi:hypothetical protein
MQWIANNKTKAAFAQIKNDKKKRQSTKLPYNTLKVLLKTSLATDFYFHPFTICSSFCQ